MKTKLILTLAALLITTGLRATVTPYAVYCEADQSLHFLTAESEPSGKLGDQTISQFWKVNVNQNSTYPDSPNWNGSSVLSNIKTVIFEDSFKEVTPNSCKQWFEDFTNLTTIENFENLNTQLVNNMSNMFSGCESLVTLDLSSFITSNVTILSTMFSGCSALTSVNLSSFNTPKLTNMSSMFYNCSSLQSLDLSAFNTCLVTNMSNMFYGCSGLTALNLSSFDTSSVNYMNNIFYGCSGLTALNLSSFDTSSVTNMTNMFYGCRGLTALNVSSFDTSSVTDMSHMFDGCSGLTTLNLSSFNTSSVKYYNNMFYKCSSLEKIFVCETFTAEGVNTGSLMFYGCSKLTNNSTTSSKVNADYAHFGTGGYFTYYKPCAVFDSAAKTLTFKNASSPTEPCYVLNKKNDTPEWLSYNTSVEKVVFDPSFSDVQATTCNQWFNGCTKLKIEGVENFNTSYLTDNGALLADGATLRLVDMSSETADCSTIVKLLPQNALVYVPANTTVDKDRANVVVGGTCQHFVINLGDVEHNQNVLNIPYEFAANKVTVNRKFSEGKPHSLYLPFSVSARDFGTFYTYAGYTDTSVQFNPLAESTTSTSPNTPYMFIPSADYDNGIVVNGDVTITVTPEQTEADGYIGVYEKKIFTKEDENSSRYYGWAENEFRRAGERASVDACRAYLRLPEQATNNAPTRIAAKFGDNVLTGISDINSEATTGDSPAYNLNGQRVSDNYNGIIIKDGKKIINRAY